MQAQVVGLDLSHSLQFLDIESMDKRQLVITSFDHLVFICIYN